MGHKPLKVVTLNFTVLEFYEHFVVSSMFENEILNQKRVDGVTLICLEFFKGENFVYIAHRKADYNVDPTIYIHLTNLNLLKGIAVVSTIPPAVSMAKFEKKFSPVPFEIFAELEDAMEWATELILNKKADL